MKRRSFIKVIGAAAGAITAGVAVTVTKAKENYSHWNQPLKGDDRRRYFKRDSIYSEVREGEKLTRTEGPMIVEATDREAEVVEMGKLLAVLPVADCHKEDAEVADPFKMQRMWE